MAATQWYQAVHASKRYRLGTRKTDSVGNDYIYGKGVASNVLGAVVIFKDSAYTPILSTNASLTGLVAISLSANTSATNFSWYLVKGNTKNVVNLAGLVGIDTGSTDAASCSTSSATSGRVVGGGVVATKTIVGMWAQGVSASNLGDALLENPMVAGGSLA
jgi:hypothetical protein